MNFHLQYFYTCTFLKGPYSDKGLYKGPLDLGLDIRTFKEGPLYNDRDTEISYKEVDASTLCSTMGTTSWYSFYRPVYKALCTRNMYTRVRVRIFKDLYKDTYEEPLLAQGL